MDIKSLVCGDFSHMIQDDISAIVRNIRAAHKSDSESAPPTTIAKELKQDLENVANFKGSLLEKSKFFKSYVSQRKKEKEKNLCCMVVYVSM